MAITIIQVNSAIASRLSAATGLSAGETQDHDELQESITESPTLQVYWVSEQTDPDSGTAQSSFGGGVIQVRWTFNADLYAQQRRHIGEDMGALLPLVDAIHDELEEEVQNAPYFGLSGIKAIESWSPRQVIFRYGDPEQPYIGTRFPIVVRIF